MTARTIAGDRPQDLQAVRPQVDPPRSEPLGRPLADQPQQLHRLASEILCDATHRPLELLERFDTQQQGE